MALFRRKKDVAVSSTEKTAKPESTDTVVTSGSQTSIPEEKAFDGVAPKNIGKLDMVIAFDTTGSMASYIDAVRQEVSDLIPQLFEDNDDLRLGIVAFGDYCDIENAQTMGAAYQCIPPTDSTNDLIKFVKESQNTHGGDMDEFYELVIKKIVEETPWREGSTRSVLLIADAEPHKCGYSYAPYVENNQIDWREEAMKAAAKGIKFDTVTIRPLPWFKELSMMTDGVSVPFKTGHKTGNLVRASVWSRGSMEARMKFDKLEEECNDEEIKDVLFAYKATRNKF